jgi:anti-sigma28 factor (negative regulator of flagellin synthesis)
MNISSLSTFQKKEDFNVKQLQEKDVDKNKDNKLNEAQSLSKIEQIKIDIEKGEYKIDMEKTVLSIIDTLI